MLAGLYNHVSDQMVLFKMEKSLEIHQILIEKLGHFFMVDTNIFVNSTAQIKINLVSPEFYLNFLAFP